MAFGMNIRQQRRGPNGGQFTVPQNRVPKGVSTGGRFAATVHAEPGISLDKAPETPSPAPEQLTAAAPIALANGECIELRRTPEQLLPAHLREGRLPATDEEELAEKRVLDLEQSGMAIHPSAERSFIRLREQRQAEIDELRAQSGRPARPEQEPEARFTKAEIDSARRSRAEYEDRQRKEADYWNRREESGRSVRRMMGIRY